MLQTVEGILDQDGVLKLLEPVKLAVPHRVLITILEEEPTPCLSVA